MKLPKLNWLNIAREIGIVLGFVSIFFAWQVGNGFLYGLEIPLARYIDPNAIWSLLQVWPPMLAPISGLVFLAGCVILLFSKWGAVAQILGLIIFLGHYLISPVGYQDTNLGIGFYFGALSAMICFITGFVLRGDWFSRSAKEELKQ